MPEINKFLTNCWVCLHAAQVAATRRKKAYQRFSVIMKNVGKGMLMILTKFIETESYVRYKNWNIFKKSCQRTPNVSILIASSTKSSLVKKT